MNENDKFCLNTKIDCNIFYNAIHYIVLTKGNKIEKTRIPFDVYSYKVCYYRFAYKFIKKAELIKINRSRLTT